MRIKQSVCYPMLKPQSMALKDLCAAVAEMGYKAIELWFPDVPLGEIVEAVRSKGLAVASMCGHKTLQDGLNKVENHDRIEGELRQNIDAAAKLGIPGLICFSGNRNPGQSDCEGMVACAKGLRRIAGYAEEKRVNLNVELLNSKVDHAGYQCDRTDWGAALCEMVGSSRVKLLYDIYHMQIMEGDVIRSIRKHIKWIGHFHTAGNPGRGDFDDTQELNYRGICKAIAGTGYEMYVGHEFKPQGDVLAALKAAYEMCNQG